QELVTEGVERQGAFGRGHRIPRGDSTDLRLALVHETAGRHRHRGTGPRIAGLLPERARGLLVRLLQIAFAVRLLALLRQLVGSRAGNRGECRYQEPHQKTRLESRSIVHDPSFVVHLSAVRPTWLEPREGRKVSWRDLGKLLPIFDVTGYFVGSVGGSPAVREWDPYGGETVAKINTGRVIQGGLLAGLVINVISILNNGMLLAPKYMADRQAGRFLLEPRFPFYPAWMIAMFLLGLELVWLYAAVRPRFGPG